jgi:hypothetical protein
MPQTPPSKGSAILGGILKGIGGGYESNKERALKKLGLLPESAKAVEYDEKNPGAMQKMMAFEEAGSPYQTRYTAPTTSGGSPTIVKTGGPEKNPAYATRMGEIQARQMSNPESVTDAEAAELNTYLKKGKKADDSGFSDFLNK